MVVSRIELKLNMSSSLRCRLAFGSHTMGRFFQTGAYCDSATYVRRYKKRRE